MGMGGELIVGKCSWCMVIFKYGPVNAARIGCRTGIGWVCVAKEGGLK